MVTRPDEYVAVAHRGSLVPRLSGRDGELATVRASVSGLADGRGGVVLVGGEPGIGRSSLVRAALADAPEFGLALRWGAGTQALQRVAFAPFLDALRDDLPGLELSRGWAGAALGSSPGPRSEEPEHPAPASEMFLALVEDLCGVSPLILVLDDLQWADEGSVRIWARLARSVRHMPLLLVGMARSVPVRHDLRIVRQRAGEQVAAGRGAVVDLQPLAAPAVDELVGALLGGRPGTGMRRLAAGAGGNPRYLTELVAALCQDGVLVTEQGGPVEVAAEVAPASFVAAAHSRLAFLSDSVRDLLSTAAMLGDEFTVGELAAMTGRPTVELVQALAEARVSGVLADRDGAMVFRHPLVRAALYRHIPATDRLRGHLDTAGLLARAGAPPTRIARQMLAALDGRDAPGRLPDWVADWLFDHSRVVVDGGPQVAVPVLRSVVESLAAADPRRPVLAARLAVALFMAGEDDEAERRATHVLAPDQVSVHRDLAARLWELRTGRLVATGRAAAAGRQLAEAIAAPGRDAVARARLEALLTWVRLAGGAHVRTGEAAYAGTVAAARDDLEVARAGRDRWTTTLAVRNLALALDGLGACRIALALVDEAIDLSEDDPEMTGTRLGLWGQRATVLGNLGRHADAEVALRTMHGEAELVGSVGEVLVARRLRVVALFERGAWDDALAELEVYLRRSAPCSGSGHHAAGPVGADVAGIAAVIALHRDDDARARALLAAGASAGFEAGDSVSPWFVRAQALERERHGALGQALAILTRSLEASAGTTGGHVASRVLRPEAVRVALRGDDPTTARLLVQQVTRPTLAEEDGPDLVAMHCRGMLDRDPELLERVVERYRREPWPLPLAQTLEALAEVWGARGEIVPARSALSEALGSYESLGATADIERVRRQFRSWGLRRAPRAPRRAECGWESLTPAELTVAELVAEGLSNPDIAERLVLSRRTVQTHVSRILAKLDLRSRVDIARESAGRHDSRGPRVH